MHRRRTQAGAWSACHARLKARRLLSGLYKQNLPKSSLHRPLQTSAATFFRQQHSFHLHIWLALSPSTDDKKQFPITIE